MAIRKHFYNDSYFSNINTEEKSYWLGFIAADGYVTNKNYHSVSIELKYSDSQHIEKFLNSIECYDMDIIKKYKKRNGKETIAALINIYSKTMVNDLYKLGLSNNKSKELIVKIEEIPEEFHRDFWRGMVDGDGSISFDGKYKRFNLIGTLDMLNFFVSFLNKNKIFTNCSVCHKSKSPDYLYCISVGNKKDVTNILNLLYKNAKIYLDRKYELYNV